jgi:hypothetical protein
MRRIACRIACTVFGTILQTTTFAQPADRQEALNILDKHDAARHQLLERFRAQCSELGEVQDTNKGGDDCFSLTTTDVRVDGERGQILLKKYAPTNKKNRDSHLFLERNQDESAAVGVTRFGARTPDTRRGSPW